MLSRKIFGVPTWAWAIFITMITTAALASCAGAPGGPTPTPTPTPGITFNVSVDSNGQQINIQSNAPISGSISLPPMTVASSPTPTPSTPPTDGSSNSMPHPLGGPPSDDDTVITVPTIAASPSVSVTVNIRNDVMSGNTANITGTLPVTLPSAPNTSSVSGVPTNETYLCDVAPWIGEFDESAFTALDIREIHIIRGPNTTEQGCVAYFDGYGRQGFLSWHNDNSIADLSGSLLDTRERYIIAGIILSEIDGDSWVRGLTLRRWVD